MTRSKNLSSQAPGLAKSATTAKPSAEEKPAPPRMPRLTTIIEGAKVQFGGLLGYPIDSVTAVDKVEDGWRLIVTVVELNRIPAASDVLAEYEVSLDAAGELVSYKRGQRFFRSQVSSGDAE